ncbi:MAG: NADH-quinone oxidoreductase subunit H [Tetrasphaera sp.]|nr:NADH-quinone oxidoreductase subunit H [Tetrasphaera sp.]
MTRTAGAAQTNLLEPPIELAVDVRLWLAALSPPTITERRAAALPGLAVARCDRLLLDRRGRRAQRRPLRHPGADKAELVGGAADGVHRARFALTSCSPEYAGIVVLSLLFAALWLGGWHGPASVSTSAGCGPCSRAYAVAILVIWMRVAWPRSAPSQLQRLAWLWLVPLALLPLAPTVGVVVVMGW